MNTALPRRELLLALLGSSLPAAAQTQAVDVWAQVRPFLGQWKGNSEGRPGRGTVERTYAFVLGGRYVQELNVSIYPPQDKSPKGERHEHWSYFSYDRSRKLLMLRQFHVEGFINTYRQAAATEATGALVFESEAFENLPAGWQARESYQFPTPDEVIETFELSSPGKPFEVYSRTTLSRQRP